MLVPAEITSTTPSPNLWILPQTSYNKSCANALCGVP